MRASRGGEIKQAGLLGGHGLILGRASGWLAVATTLITLPGQQGVALAAPPRAGKGVGVVMPNPLNWPDSLVCIDIKSENWTLTAGYRAASRAGRSSCSIRSRTMAAPHAGILLDYVGASEPADR